MDKDSEPGKSSGDDVEISQGIPLVQLESLVIEYDEMMARATSHAMPDWEEWMLAKKMPFVMAHETARGLLRVTAAHMRELNAQSREVKQAELRLGNVKAQVVGGPLEMLCRCVLSKRGYKQLVEPHILDMRFEYAEAKKAGNDRMARWVVLRGYLLVLRPFIAALLSTIVALWKMAK